MHDLKVITCQINKLTYVDVFRHGITSEKTKLHNMHISHIKLVALF